MVQMIRYELHKVFQKKIVGIAIVAMLIYCVFVYNENVDPFGMNTALVLQDGTVVTGKKAVAFDKAVALEYKGVLNDEKVIQIYNEFKLNFDELKLAIDSGTDWKQNNMYRSIDRFFLTTSNEKISQKSDNPNTVENVFPWLEKVIVGYSKPWSCTIYAIQCDMIFLGFLLIISLSPLFSEEYSTGMAELLLTSKLGRGKGGVVLSKVIAAYIVCFGFSFSVIIINLVPTFLTVVQEGMECSAQLAYPFLFQHISTDLKIGELLQYSCIFYVCSMISVTALTIILSSCGRNSFNVLVLAVTLYVTPAFLNNIGIPVEITMLAPMLQLDLPQIFGIGKVNIAGKYIYYAWGIVLVTFMYFGIANRITLKKFSKHQVQHS